VTNSKIRCALGLILYKLYRYNEECQVTKGLSSNERTHEVISYCQVRHTVGLASGFKVYTICRLHEA